LRQKNIHSGSNSEPKGEGLYQEDISKDGGNLQSAVASGRNNIPVDKCNELLAEKDHDQCNDAQPQNGAQ
jgi:hypothetical protein